MKKFIITLLVTAVLFSIGATENNVVSAKSQYAMIVTDDATFYSDASGRFPKFYLDKSYFVKVIEVIGEYARVNYMDGYVDAPELEGYVKVVDLSFYDKDITSPYPEITLTAVNDVVMFSDAQLTKPRSVVPVHATAKYYGCSDNNGVKTYYVYCQGFVGYVQSAAFKEFSLPYHNEYLALLAANSSDTHSQSDYSPATDSAVSAAAPTQNTTQIILIALLIIVGLTLLFFVLRPDKLV